MSERLVLSVQLLNEFFWNVTRPKAKIEVPLATATEFVNLLIRTAEIVPLKLSTTLSAMSCHSKHSIQYFDALIWAAAKENGVPTIYTEDFQHDRDIDGVRFINPFAAE